MFVFGILRGGAHDRFAEPALDQESGEVERVALLFRKGLCILEISQERQGDGWGPDSPSPCGCDSITYATVYNGENALMKNGD